MPRPFRVVGAKETPGINSGLSARRCMVEDGRKRNGAALALTPGFRPVHQDVEDPCFQRGTTFEPFQPLKDSQPGFLYHFLGHSPAIDEDARQPQQAGVMPSNQVCERALIPFAEGFEEKKVFCTCSAAT